MGLKIDAKFEGKLICTFKIDMRNLANFHHSTLESLKLGTSIGPFIQSRKYISLKFTGELGVMKIRNDGNFDEEFTCQFKIDRRNLTNFNPSNRKSKKCALQWAALD